MQGSWIESSLIIHSGLFAELGEEGSAQALDVFYACFEELYR